MAAPRGLKAVSDQPAAPARPPATKPAPSEVPAPAAPVTFDLNRFAGAVADVVLAKMKIAEEEAAVELAKRHKKASATFFENNVRSQLANLDRRISDLDKITIGTMGFAIFAIFATAQLARKLEG